MTKGALGKTWWTVGAWNISAHGEDGGVLYRAGFARRASRKRRKSFVNTTIDAAFCVVRKMIIEGKDNNNIRRSVIIYCP